MFHQVRVHPDDQHCQRFLWNNGAPGSTPSVYVMQVMTFGASCSPSCAQFVKNINAERFAEDSPAAAKAIINDHYVDDMLSSVETEQEAIKLASSVRDIHGQGGFEIRGWRSNSKAVLAALNSQECEDKNLSEASQFSTEKVLGMWWDSSTDTFTFRLPTKPDKDLLNGLRVPTKKEVVRVLMSIFDPLGLLANVLMFLKVLIQEIWRSGIGWNATITPEQYEKWLVWLKVIEKVEAVSIPRCYRQITSSSSKTNVQLHTFVDASTNGCATVAFLRFEEEDRIECAFVAGKTRVAPNKLTSIPRLEIDAGTMGVRLAQKIMEGLRIVIHQRFFWTDARDVLCWLHADHRNYSQFVGFRVAEILEKSNLAEWNYCPSKLNPADDGTKWTKIPDLSEKSRWLHVICFIQQKMSEWPNKLIHIGTTTTELKHSVGVHCVTAQVINPEEFSTWKRLLRYTVHCKRYVRNLKETTSNRPRTTGEITQEELLAAEAYLHRLAQEAEYIEEIAILIKAGKGNPNGLQIPKGSPIFKLSPYLDHGSKPLVAFDNGHTALRNNWKASQIYANLFWKKWVKEYLPTICRRTKWHQPVKPIQVGDVVVIADPDHPRNSWPMGRVVSTNTSKDGQVRSAVVRTSERFYERPAVKLAVLDVGVNEGKLPQVPSVPGGNVTSLGRATDDNNTSEAGTSRMNDSKAEPRNAATPEAREGIDEQAV
ncbi:uncharacterized protein LOC119769295 [Culex quinquefasciatus]|uniref:uncharacterized protein LOC119769295 n=1 Tax=Culex quinquefasciatus TaxID=7176 RepID=UPI0018E3CA43|nr:uncharacterized protein LOC119769295 [Culex quinquefasciatus]